MSKNILILQHIPIETPGYLLDLMKLDKFNLTVVELDQGEKIPNNLSSFDAMLCMGGPMDTWMEKEFPWLIEEKNRIKEYVINLKKPYLGFCLGCQLLGEVLGGKVIKSNPPEIGILDINMSKERALDNLFYVIQDNTSDIILEGEQIQEKNFYESHISLTQGSFELLNSPYSKIYNNYIDTSYVILFYINATTETTFKIQ